MKKNILNSNNVIAFDPIKIQTCLAPHSDRQHLISVKDTYVDANKMTTKGHKSRRALKYRIELTA
jgi:hypothetical protein